MDLDLKTPHSLLQPWMDTLNFLSSLAYKVPGLLSTVALSYAMGWCALVIVSGNIGCR
jgi:hypothetical protein